MVGLLLREIAEQKRVDLAVASSSVASLSSSSLGPSGIGPSSAGVGHPSPHSENPPPSRDFVLPSAAGRGVVPLLGAVGSGGGGVGVGTAAVNGANIHVVLPGDRDAQRRKHRAKIAYYEKGAQYRWFLMVYVN